jgi:enterochelin esterase-like enzyme
MLLPRKTIGLAIFLCMVAATARIAGGQGPRGAVGGGRAGTVQQIMVQGKALEGNREGDSANRSVTVYLPPSYASDLARRYPVIYFLHDYGERSDAAIDAIKPFADRLDGAQGFSEAIVVTPDANTSRRENMYSGAAAAGDWERFIAEDLVAQIDMQFRTLATRMSRGLAGHLMGGYGTMRIGMKRADVFSSLYVMSACCLGDGGTLAMLEQSESNLKKYYGIAIDIGTKDASISANRQLHDAMARLRIPHYYEEYAGDHAGQLSLRIERNLLPFFSKNLAAPENPTAPGVQ